MKITHWRRTVALSLVAAGLWTPSRVHAVDIPLADASFEDYSVPTTGAAANYAYSDLYRGGNPFSAWVDDQDSPEDQLEDDGESNWLYNSTYAEASIKRAHPRTGNQAMHGISHYSTQEVGALFEAGKTYTFSAYTQGDDNTVGDDSRVWLYLFDGSVDFSEANSLSFATFSPQTGDFVNRPVGTTAAQSAALWQRVSVSHTVQPGAPEVGQPIGVGFWARRDGAVDDATLTVETSALTLLVNVSDGSVRIVNETGQSMALNQYQITSAGNSLNEAGWTSLQDQNLSGFPAGTGSGNGWEEAGGASDAVLSESYLTATSSLAPAAQVSLGAAFSTADPQDLVFQYGLVTPQLDSDFDANSLVDGNDLLRWQRGLSSFGAGVTKGSGNANTDATVNGHDLAVWSDQFGSGAGPSGAGVLTRGVVRYVGAVAATSIPEPGAGVLAGLGALAAWRRRLGR